MKDNVKIYEADISIKSGVTSLWKEMFLELKNSRELIWQLFKRDFLAKYKQTMFGFLWAIIMPLGIVGVFVFLNRAGILNIGKTEVPYPVYAVLGLTLWQLFASGITTMANSILQGGSMVIKINFPKETLVIASYGQVIIEFLIRSILLLILFFFFKTIPKWTILFFPLTLIPIVLLTIGLGFIFSLFSALMRDIPNILSLVTTFMLFITPVLYPAPLSGYFYKISLFNPLAVLITGSKEMVFTGYFSHPELYFITTTISFVFFLICWQIFHLVEPKMAERI